MEPIKASDWIKLSNCQTVVESLTNSTAIEDFQAVISATKRFDDLDWIAAVAILHMVYGWMPTMLRPIREHTDKERQNLVEYLNRVRNGCHLKNGEMEAVKKFANCSVVGASKLLHVINSNKYVIWDSRVAPVFLAKPNVSRQTYNTVKAYQMYITTLRKWAEDNKVLDRCGKLRDLNELLQDSSNLRLIELVLFNAPRNVRT